MLYEDAVLSTNVKATGRENVCVYFHINRQFRLVN